MRPSVVLAISRSTFREFWRTPEAVFWTYGFPILMAVVLGIAFSSSEPAPVRVVVLEQSEGASQFHDVLASSPRIHVEILNAESADRALVMGSSDVIVGGDLTNPELRLDPTRPSSGLARMVVDGVLQRHAGRTDPVTVEVITEDRPGARYIDFLIPGLIGLNLLGAGMWGVGYNLVNMRSKKLLRRLLVTPMSRAEFLLGFLISRMVLMIPEGLVILLFGMLIFGVPVSGSFLDIFLLVLFGGFSFAGLGVLVASRARTTEGVAGLMNLVLLPMWLLGGSFFSNERFPAVLQPVVKALPLTHLNDALRESLLGAAGFAEVWGALAFLLAFGVACFVLALRIFRWS